MTEQRQYGSIKYLVHFPDGFDSNTEYPALLVLHGSGKRGDDLAPLERSTALQRLFERNDSIVFVPLCSAVNWNRVMPHLVGFAEYISDLDCIDKNRLYLTGYSMGGYGAWELGCECPWLFAAVMPISGGGIPWHAYRLKHVPVYAFHGMLDNEVTPDESLKMACAVNLSGGRAELTLFPDKGHGIVEYVYGNREYIDKLFGHVSDGKMPDFSEFTNENYG